jgi:hypothetical protein
MKLRNGKLLCNNTTLSSKLLCNNTTLSDKLLCSNTTLSVKKNLTIELKSGKVLDSSNYQKEYFQKDFITLFYGLKGQYNYTDFHNNPTFETKYTLCNLYAAYKTFFNKEYIDPFGFLYNLSQNTLLQYKDLPKDNNCYICGMDDCTPALYCHNGHYTHIECYFEQILVTIKPMYTTFLVPNNELRCDYCSDPFNMNTN